MEQRKFILIGKTATSLEDERDVEVLGDYDCSDTKITSLEGCPRKVRGSFLCYNTTILSLEGCPRDIGVALYCHSTLIGSLHNVHKMIDRIGSAIYISETVCYDILGLLRIRDLQSVQVVVGTTGSTTHHSAIHIRPHAAMSIVNRYLVRKPNPMDRDIQRCQEELIEAGFANYANL